MSVPLVVPSEETSIAGSFPSAGLDFSVTSSGITVTRVQGWGQVQLVKYSNTSSTRNQVQVLCIFTNQVLKYIKY